MPKFRGSTSGREYCQYLYNSRVCFGLRRRTAIRINIQPSCLIAMLQTASSRRHCNPPCTNSPSLVSTAGHMNFQEKTSLAMTPELWPTILGIQNDSTDDTMAKDAQLIISSSSVQALDLVWHHSLFQSGNESERRSANLSFFFLCLLGWVDKCSVVLPCRCSSGPLPACRRNGLEQRASCVVQGQGGLRVADA